METFVLIARGLLVLAVVVLVVCAIQAWHNRMQERMLSDFRKHFPNKCPVCSYYRYLRREGMSDEPTPPHEACKERSAVNDPPPPSPSSL